jgi:hypothetical protein
MHMNTFYFCEKMHTSYDLAIRCIHVFDVIHSVEPGVACPSVRMCYLQISNESRWNLVSGVCTI